MTTVVISTTSSRAPYSSSSSTPWASPMLAKIRPTSPRGIIPKPISRRSAAVPAAPYAETILPAMAITRRIDGVEQHARAEHRAEVGVDADEHEEHRDEHATDAVEVVGDAFVLVAAADRQPGHEGADDERQLGRVGEHGEAEHDHRGRRR